MTNSDQADAMTMESPQPKGAMAWASRWMATYLVWSSVILLGILFVQSVLLHSWHATNGALPSGELIAFPHALPEKLWLVIMLAATCKLTIGLVMRGDALRNGEPHRGKVWPAALVFVPMLLAIGVIQHRAVRDLGWLRVNQGLASYSPGDLERWAASRGHPGMVVAITRSGGRDRFWQPRGAIMFPSPGRAVMVMDDGARYDLDAQGTYVGPGKRPLAIRVDPMNGRVLLLRDDVPFFIGVVREPGSNSDIAPFLLRIHDSTRTPIKK